MEFLEKDLEGIIYDAYKKDILSLNSKGLNISGEIKRQLRIGNYGVADLITFKRGSEYDFMPDREIGNLLLYSRYNIPKLTITVYELKKDKIGISAYFQALRYIKGIQKYLNQRCFFQKVDYKIVLIGRKLDVSGSFCFITDFDENVDFYTYKYGLNGLEFDKKINYEISESNFKL